MVNINFIVVDKTEVYFLVLQIKQFAKKYFLLFLTDEDMREM